MKYEESYSEFDIELLGLLKKAVPDSFAEKLQEGGIELEFPKDRELELKVKYDVSEEGGSYTLKVSWDNELDEEEEENEDESED